VPRNAFARKLSEILGDCLFTSAIHAHPAMVYGATIFPMAHESRHRHEASYFDQSDVSMHMLGMPKARPQLRTWLLLAILTGTVLALALVLLGNMIS
jgi:hypothetical protein